MCWRAFHRRYRWASSPVWWVGKPVGVMLSSFLAVKLRMGVLAADMAWKHVLGIGILAGMGFTMSIFVTVLSYAQPAVQLQAKTAILLASAVAGICGFLFVRRAVRQ